MIAAGIVGTVQMLAGPPEVILTTWLIVAAFWICQCLFRETGVLPSLKRLVLLVLIITGLSAGQLFPFFDLLARSQRGASYSTSEWSMPPTGWANLLVPLFYCFKTPAGPYMQYDQNVFSSYYLGIVTLTLAFFATWRVREWKVWLLGAITVSSLILALGDAGYLYGMLRRIIPATGFMRYPVKFVTLAAFAVPILAAFGVRQLWRARGEYEAECWKCLIAISAAVLASILLILWFARCYPAGQEPWMTTAANGLERAAILSLVLGVLYYACRVRELGKRRVLGLGVLVLVWLDAATHVPPQNPTVVRTVYEPDLLSWRELKPRPKLGECRATPSFSALWLFSSTMLSDPSTTYLGERLGLLADCNLLDGVPKVDGFYALYVKEEFETRALLFLSTNTVPREDLSASEVSYIATNKFATNLADFLGVCQITSPGTIFDWEVRPTFMPLVTSGQRPVFVDAAGSLWGLLHPEFNPREVVFLPVEAKPFVTVSTLTHGRVVSQQFTAHRVTLEVDAQQASLVVVAQTYYPCWYAYVDGQPTRLWRANHAFQALQVPSGRHQVQLIFQDKRFLTGMAISGVILFRCLICLVGVRGQRSKKNPTHRRTVVASETGRSGPAGLRWDGA
jgi:hypothetical protein